WLDREFPAADRDGVAGRERLDVRRMKTEVQKRHTFASRGKQIAFFGVAQRLDAQRIAGDQQIALSIQKDKAVSPVESLAYRTHYVHQSRATIARQLAADFVHD